MAGPVTDGAMRCGLHSSGPPERDGSAPLGGLPAALLLSGSLRTSTISPLYPFSKRDICHVQISVKQIALRLLGAGAEAGLEPCPQMPGTRDRRPAVDDRQQLPVPLGPR